MSLLVYRPAVVLPLLFVGLALFGLASLSHISINQIALSLSLLAALALLMGTDIAVHRLPNTLTFGLLGTGVVLAAAGLGPPLLHSLVGASVGYGVIALLRALYFWRRGVEGIGLGDAKLLAAFGAWFGWAALPQMLALSSVAALLSFGVIAVYQRILVNRVPGSERDSSPKIAFGPYLCATFWFAWHDRLDPELQFYLLM